MTDTTAPTRTITQVHRVFIRATAQQVWDAITDPDWNSRHGYHARMEYDLRPGGLYRVLPNKEMVEYGAPDVIIDGEVVSADPPHRLVQTWHAMFTPEMAAEPKTQVTWELEEQPPGITRLTVTHELENAPSTAWTVAGDNPNAGGGWPFMLSDIKTLLETGKAFQD